MLGLLWSIFFVCAKVGILGYGGGPSIIPLFQREVVREQQWMDEEEWLAALAMGNALPGPIATKMSAYIGYKLAGYPGAVVGILGMVFPSTVLMLILTIFFFSLRDHPFIKAMLAAVKPAVVGLLIWTVWDLWPGGVKRWDHAVIAVATFVAVVFLNIHPALAILAAAALGLAIYR